MGKKKLRDARRAKQRKQKIISTLIWGSVGVGGLVLLGFMVWKAVRPSGGQSVPIMPNAGAHISEGSDPGPYNSDPPTSGQHYDLPLEANFYEETSPEVRYEYPEGYLLHNLEHGYVIYWYNCTLLEDNECINLKDQIKESMAENNQKKIIAFPRASLDVQIVLTSWGQMLQMEKFDADQARQFISTNRNRAPEPNAP